MSKDLVLSVDCLSVDCLAGPCEPLEKHSVEVATCVEKSGQLVAKKIARVFGASEDEVLDLMMFGALAHDVGKSDITFRGSNGFYPMHEARSTAFVLYVFDKAGLRPSCSLEGRSLADLVLAMVALHHYSHKDYRISKPVGLTPRCPLNWFLEWAPKTQLGRRLREIALSVRDVSETQCHADIISTIGKPLDPKLSMAVSALLGVLGKCDVEVAKRNRCD